MQTILSFSLKAASSLSYLLLTSLLIVVPCANQAVGQNMAKPKQSANRQKSAVKDKKMSTQPVKVRLDIDMEEGEAKALLTFTNVSSREAYLNRVNGCLGDAVQNNVFSIKTGDQKLAYTLPLVKRRDNGERDVIKIAPGQTVTTRLNLSAAYAFLHGRHSYTATYEGMHYDPHNDILLDLTSNQASFILEKK